MRRPLRALAPTLLLLALAAGPAALEAQESYTFSIAALGGTGGSLDADVGDGLGNQTLQLNLGLVTEPKTHLFLRLGTLDLDPSEGFQDLTGGELVYATIAGEYRYDNRFYESGIYLGLGGYELSGTSIFSGTGVDETGIGLVLGLTGEFELTRRLGVLIELAGHYADLERANVYATAHIGLIAHF